MDATSRTAHSTPARGDIFQYTGDGTGGGDLAFTGNAVSNNEPSIATGGGGITTLAGAGPRTMDVSNNTMRDSLTHALTVVKSRGSGPNNGTHQQQPDR